MSIVAPRGFVAAGGAVGIKAGGAADLAVVATEDGVPASAAGVFTSNLAPAAPVQISREHLADSGGRAAAVVLTSGNANAATGEPGRKAARGLCELVGRTIGVPGESVVVCQTGLIGIPFPFEVVGPRVAGVVERRAATTQAGREAAEAMMTTDTVRKEVVVEAGPAVVGGMAKGAAMLAPNMATMLAVLTTDAAIDPPALGRLLSGAVGPTFNSLSVDGCTSTNDTVLVLANGRAGVVPEETLGQALTEACRSLAMQMAEDAEGATKVVHVIVEGARDDVEAHRAARKVADSLLVKCSLYGADPYWGRVVSELATAGVDFDPGQVSVAYGGVAVCRSGEAAAHDGAAVAAHLAGRHVELRCHLGLGPGRGVVLGTDLGPGYIEENRTTS